MADDHGLLSSPKHKSLRLFYNDMNFIKLLKDESFGTQMILAQFDMGHMEPHKITNKALNSCQPPVNGVLRPYSKSSLTLKLNEWKLNLSFS